MFETKCHMKKLVTSLLLLSLALSLAAQEKKEIVKTGLNFGPLPAIAYDADKGLQLGAILQIFDYGDGHNYPNYDAKTYFEYSHFTKGSNLIQVRHDNKELIHNVRWSSALRINLDKAFDFYGFNGYGSYYDAARVADGKAGNSYLFSPFYRFSRNEIIFKSDFLGRITEHLQWEAGIFANYYKTGTIDYDNINKGKSDAQKYPALMPTLYEIYHDSGIISDKDFDGGFCSGIRLGLNYDSRDKEGAPTRGIWAEGHVSLSPKFLSESPFYKYSLTMRQYFPLVKNDILTLAYRLNYEGTFGNSAPFYVLPYITNMGEKVDFEGMGGYNTVRGIMRTRVVGLDMATYNIELRGRFCHFSCLNQNIALGLSAFSDGTMVTRGLDLSKLSDEILTGLASKIVLKNSTKEIPHITFGAGFRFIMNENFIVCAEYGMPLTHFMKNSPLHDQDGTGAFYVNLGYLF